MDTLFYSLMLVNTGYRWHEENRRLLFHVISCITAKYRVNRFRWWFYKWTCFIHIPLRFTTIIIYYCFTMVYINMEGEWIRDKNQASNHSLDVHLFITRHARILFYEEWYEWILTGYKDINKQQVTHQQAGITSGQAGCMNESLKRNNEWKW